MNEQQTAGQAQKTGQLPLSDRIAIVFEKHRKPIITLVTLLVVAGAGALLWMQKTKMDNEQASIALSKITPWIEEGDEAKAINGSGGTKGLKAIASEYGNTTGGNLARLYLATIYFNQGKNDAALALFDAFSHKDGDLKASALAGAAACRIQKSEFAKAAEGYAKASESARNESLKGQYLNKAGDAWVLAGKPEKAKPLFDDVVRQWPGSSPAREAGHALLRLSGSGVQ